MPKYAIVFMVFTLGALGLPGTSGFIGEFLVLMGAFKKNILVATIASLGVILGAAYMLWLYKRIIFGKLINEDVKKMVDLKRFEIVTLWLLVLPIIFFNGKSTTYNSRVIYINNDYVFINIWGI